MDNFFLKTVFFPNGQNKHFQWKKSFYIVDNFQQLCFMLLGEIPVSFCFVNFTLWSKTEEEEEKKEGKRQV